MMSGGFLIIILGICGGISFMQMKNIDQSLQEKAGGGSSEKIILMLSRQTSEATRAVADYVRTLESKFSKQLTASKAEVEKLIPLLANQGEKDLAYTLTSHYGEYNQLSEQITKLAYDQYTTLQLFRLDIKKINEILEQQLAPRTGKKSADAMEQSEASLKMRSSVNKFYGLVEAYLSVQNETIQKDFEAAIAQFSKFYDTYRNSPITAQEEEWIGKVNEAFL